MRYDENMIEPMRAELRQIGVQELRTAEEVETFMGQKSGTALVIVNSVCGCAAGNARPGLALALKSGVKPDRVATVFAGQDTEATAKMREYFKGTPPSSPCFSIFKNGEFVSHIPRQIVEQRDAAGVAHELADAFNACCS